MFRLGSGGGRFVRLWRCRLLSVSLGEQASDVACKCFGTKWYRDVPGARSSPTRDDRQYFAGFQT